MAYRLNPTLRSTETFVGRFEQPASRRWASTGVVP
jgi:hypothetical protein